MGAKQRITVRPIYVRRAGWVLYLRPERGSASPPCHWGGDGKATPEEALAAYRAAVEAAFPSFALSFRGATPAQKNRAWRG